MIEKYIFGLIVVDGKNYHYDIEVRSGFINEVLSWQRKESHLITIEDIKRAVEQKPDMIIIGTGDFGVAKISEDCQELIERKGIKLIIDKTEQAIKTFNIIDQESLEEEGARERVIGLFHLTC